MSGESLIYMPLGGAGEIGMNAYVYGYGEPGQERLIVVDLGVTFGDMDGTPGIDLILPDIAWLAERRGPHRGDLHHPRPRGPRRRRWASAGTALRAPVYARRFTMAIAGCKLEERGARSPTRCCARSGPGPQTFEARALHAWASCRSATPSPRARAW